MSTATVTYTFVNGNANDGPEVSQNFTDLTTYINSNCIVKDATLAFTSIPSGPAADASSANQFVRKALLDARTASGYLSWGPLWAQGATISKSITYGKYVQMGKHVVAQCVLVASSAGTPGNTVAVTLPVTAAATGAIGGSFELIDAGTIVYAGYAEASTTTSGQFVPHNTSAAMGPNGYTVASGDTLKATFIYESV